METKNKSSVIQIEHNPDESNSLVVVERTSYVLKRGIFNIAFLKKVEKLTETEINQKDKKLK